MGYVIGGFLGLALAYFAGSVVLGDFMTGLIPGIAFALWIGSNLNHKFQEERQNFLYPAPRSYPLTYKEAFTKVEKFIGEFVFNYGRSFRIKTSDNKAGEIVADMNWSDMESVGDKRKEKVERHIRLNIYFDKSKKDTTSIAFRWYPRSEGMNFSVCDEVINEFNSQLAKVLPQGTLIEEMKVKKEKWAAPMWLHLVVIASAFLYASSSMSSLGPLTEEVKEKEKQIAEQSEVYDLRRKALDKEIEEWDKFKRTFDPGSIQRSRDAFRLAPPPASYSQAPGGYGR